MFSLALQDEELPTTFGWGHDLNDQAAQFNNTTYTMKGLYSRSGSGYGHGEPYGHGDAVSVSSLLGDHGPVVMPVPNKPLGMGILPSPLSVPQLRSANDARRGYRSKTLVDAPLAPPSTSVNRGGLGDTKGPPGGHVGRAEPLGADKGDKNESRNEALQGGAGGLGGGTCSTHKANSFQRSRNPAFLR